MRRLVARQERTLALQRELLQMLEQLEHPPILAVLPDLPTPVSDQLEEMLQPEPPPLTEQEMQELAELPMPDPVAEMEAALGLSTSPQSRPTWAD